MQCFLPADIYSPQHCVQLPPQRGRPGREAAIHSDFQINIYPVSKQAGVYLVYTQHMPLFQRCIGNDLNSVFRTGASTILLTESRKMETAAFTMNRQIATEAMGSRMGNQGVLPEFHEASTEEGIGTVMPGVSHQCRIESFEQPHGYTNTWFPLTAMEMAAAASARKPGNVQMAGGKNDFKESEMPMPSPVANNTTESSRAATHSMRSWP